MWNETWIKSLWSYDRVTWSIIQECWYSTIALQWVPLNCKCYLSGQRLHICGDFHYPNFKMTGQLIRQPFDGLHRSEFELTTCDMSRSGPTCEPLGPWRCDNLRNWWPGASGVRVLLAKKPRSQSIIAITRRNHVPKPYFGTFSVANTRILQSWILQNAECFEDVI